MSDSLSMRQRTTWLAHLFKALTKSYHGEAEHFLRPLLPRDGVVFDVGAHAGQFAKRFAALAPHGRVYAFEPSPYALTILRPMLALKRLKNVTLIEAGISSEPGEQVLNIPIKKRGTLGFGLAHLGDEVSGRAVKSYPIHLTTIDLVVAQHNITRMDFIKADVEGWEFHMLKGGAASIAKFRPSVLIEVAEAQLARAGVTPPEVFAFFAALNYVARFTDEHDAYKLSPAPAYIKPGDYLFVPSEKEALLPAQ